MLLGPGAVKPGAVVVDVGVHRTAKGLCSDVDTAAVRAVTPVPGGIGR
jgi:methylenetetrahydrofolate dehydrogenase (NADP+)/methenyltetrahydrofolate cyclohydrolase